MYLWTVGVIVTLKSNITLDPTPRNVRGASRRSSRGGVGQRGRYRLLLRACNKSALSKLHLTPTKLELSEAIKI
jgi:hypothetical protein